MSEVLSRLTPRRKSGNEAIHADGQALGPTLLDFWRRSTPDLVSDRSTTRPFVRTVIRSGYNSLLGRSSLAGNAVTATDLSKSDPQWLLSMGRP